MLTQTRTSCRSPAGSGTAAVTARGPLTDPSRSWRSTSRVPLFVSSMSQILRDSVLLNGGPAIFVFCLCSRLHLFLSVASLSSFFRWLFHRVSVFVRVRWCSSSLSFILLWGGVSAASCADTTRTVGNMCNLHLLSSSVPSASSFDQELHC